MIVRLYDTFQDVDGTALASHTPEIGGPWIDNPAGLKIVGNKCVCDAGYAASFADVIESEGLLEMTYQFVDLAHARGAYGGCANDNGGSTEYLIANKSDDGDLSCLALYDSGSFLERDLPGTANTGVHTVKIFFKGNRVIWYEDGVPVYSAILGGKLLNQHYATVQENCQTENQKVAISMVRFSSFK